MKRLLPIVTTVSLVLSGCQSEAPENTAAYADGSYEEQIRYHTPGGSSYLDITIILETGIITEMHVATAHDSETSAQYEEAFLDEVFDQVVGVAIDEVPYISAINGSSLTAQAFEEALYNIQEEAATISANDA